MTDHDLELRALVDRLADPRARTDSFADLKTHLASAFVEARRDVAEDIVERTYRRDKAGDVSIFESRFDARFLGSLSRAPEPTGGGGPGTTATGGGTTTCKRTIGTLQVPGSATKSTRLVAGAYSLLYAWVESVAMGTLIAKAQGNASANYWALYNGIAPLLCVAPCAPFSTPAVSPPPVLMTTYSRFMGVPYKVTYTAVAWQTEILTCI